MKGNFFLYTYYKQFQHLYIDHNSHLIQQCYTYFSRVIDELSTKSQPSLNQTRIPLLFKLFNAAFDETQSQGHSGEKRFLSHQLTEIFLVFLLSLMPQPILLLQTQHLKFLRKMLF